MQINSHLSVLIHDLAKSTVINQRLLLRSLAVNNGKLFRGISSL